jgi:hypothetical protein
MATARRDLVAMADGITYRRAVGYARYSSEMQMAEHYRKNLAGETAKGKRARVAAGLPNGDPPYGYRRAAATRRRCSRPYDGKRVLGIQPADEYHRLGMALPAVWSFCGTDGIRPLITTTPCAHLGRRAA